MFPAAPRLVIHAERFGGLDVFPQLTLAFPKSHSQRGKVSLGHTASGRAEVLGNTPQRAYIYYY